MRNRNNAVHNASLTKLYAECTPRRRGRTRVARHTVRGVHRCLAINALSMSRIRMCDQVSDSERCVTRKRALTRFIIKKPCPYTAKASWRESSSAVENGKNS